MTCQGLPRLSPSSPRDFFFFEMLEVVQPTNVVAPDVGPKSGHGEVGEDAGGRLIVHMRQLGHADHARQTHCSGSRLRHSNTDSGRASLVSMVQPTNQRELYDAPHLRRLHRTLLGRVLAERQMGAAGVIVLTNESPKQPSQVPLVHDDHMIEEFSPQSADNAFRIWILPRRPSRTDPFLSTSATAAPRGPGRRC
jgi:hypothetical protein